MSEDCYDIKSKNGRDCYKQQDKSVAITLMILIKNKTKLTKAVVT